MWKRVCWFGLFGLVLGPGVLSGQTLTHRYSLGSEPAGSLVATDLVATANGTLQGSAAIGTGGLILNGASGAFLNLPTRLITSGYSAATIESWVSFGKLPVNCFYYGFGNTDGSGIGQNYIFCAPQTGRIAITATNWSGEQQAYTGTDWSGQTNFHLVAIYNPPAKKVLLYTNGVLAAANTNVTTPMSAVTNIYSYVGRSLYGSDPYTPMTVAEFRMYNGALSPQQVALNAASGPSQILSSPGTLQAVRIGAAAQMVAGATQQIAVYGDFTSVSNVNLLTYGSPALVSDNSNVLTVTSSGQVSAVSPFATANIIATYNGLSATQAVTVTGFATNRFVFDSFGDGFWTIANQGNNNVLVANLRGATQEPYTNGATEQQFEVLYNLQNSTFRLRQRSSWFCVGAQYNSPKPGGAVTVSSIYSGVAAQQWYIVDAGSGYFRIFNAASNLVLQTDNANPASVTLAPPSTNAFQFWQFNYQIHYPKKGTAGYEANWSAYKTSWAYNWDDTTSASLPSQVVYEPMIWGQYWEPLSNVQSYYNAWHSTPKPIYLMTFNEPDNAGQANTSTNTAISMWPALQAMNLPLVSPAMQNTFDDWAYNFFNLIASNNYRVDYTAAHWYASPNAGSLISVLQNVYNTWGRPVWLTEFSPVDWGGAATWSENDNFNFLAEFMWRAEDLPWFKRYSIFLFSGTPSTNPWDGNGHRGDFFDTNGVVTPYGELYAAWDADRTLRTRTPFFIHNLATSFRLTSSNSVSSVQASSIRVRNATTQWALLPAPTTNHYYIVSLNDGRRLYDQLGNLMLAPLGTGGTTLEWVFTGPDSSGYYYISNALYAHNLNGTGTAPAVTFNTVSSSTQNNNTRWRLVKPYQPATIASPVIPSLSGAAGDQAVTLNWSSSDRFYNIYRSSVPGGPYSRIATAQTATTYVDYAVNNGVPDYYVVTGLNILGEESGYSAEVGVRPVSMSSPQLNFAFSNGTVQVNWPADHTGWELQVQTNPPGAGLGTNWVILANSNSTNSIPFVIDPANGCLFFRLTYP